MMILKQALHRRTFLRGAGAAVALPLLDAMVPALTATAKTAANPPMRLGFFYVSNGCTMPHWHPTGTGTEFELSRILAPLAPVRDQIVVVKYLANIQAEDNGSGPHTRVHSVWLNGVRPKRTEGADIQVGTTIDQHAARKIGQDTPLVSLELSLEPSYVVGNCDNGYSCVYQNTFSWRTPTTPLPMENNPRVVFERLFGDGAATPVRLKQMRRDRSILDAVGADLKDLSRTLGPKDQTVISEYLDSVREVEARIQRAEKQADTAPTPDVARPLGIPESDEEHGKLMIDLQLLAYRADVTRVVAFQLSREQSQRTYPYVGVPNGHHDVSHHQRQPARMDLNSRINAYHVSLTARLAEKMKNTPDGDGTLLDHAMLLHGGGMGDGDQHSPHNLPLVLIGGANGQLKGGRVLEYPVDTPMMNLGLSMLDKVGVHLESLGDSTGRLTDL